MNRLTDPVRPILPPFGLFHLGCLVVSVGLVVTGCSSGGPGSNVAGNVASVALDESGQAFIAAAEQAASPGRLAALGRLTFPDYYQLLLKTSDDQAVTINGLQLAGVHTWLTHQSATFTAMGATYENLAAAFDSAKNAVPNTTAGADLGSSLITALKYLQSDGIAHKAAGTSLALRADGQAAPAGKTSNGQAAVGASAVVHRRVLPEDWWDELKPILDLGTLPPIIEPDPVDLYCHETLDKGC